MLALSSTRLPLARRSLNPGLARLQHAITTAARQGPEVTVWFDSQCPLCIREISLFRKLDRTHRIDFRDLASPDVQLPIAQSGSTSSIPICPVTPADLLARFHAQSTSPGSILVSGAPAFAKMWRALPRDNMLGAVLNWMGGVAERSSSVMWMLEKSYRGFLVVRPTVQKMMVKAVGRPGRQ